MDNKKIWNNNWKKLSDYSKMSAGNRWAFYLIRQILKKAEIEPGLILDIGCGVGTKSAVLAERYNNNQVIGIDFSEVGVENAQKMFSNIKNLSFLCMDANSLSKYSEHNIRMVAAFSVLEHIEDWKPFLHNLCRLSQDYLLISAPTGRMRAYEKNVGHYRNFKRGQLEHFIVNEGYELIEVYYAGFPFWSPLSRNYLDFINRRANGKVKEDDLSMTVSYNRLFNSLAYFSYRYLSLKRIGDDFYGLFRKRQ